MSRAKAEQAAVLSAIKDWSQAQLVKALIEQVTFLPGSFDKRFTKGVAARLAEGKELTEKQEALARTLVAKYRRQIKEV